jgi:uncharacterized membrane protein
LVTSLQAGFRRRWPYQLLVEAEHDPGLDAAAVGRAPRRDEATVEFGRIVAFSDGVFSIAITLLVLGLFIPKGVQDLTDTLFHQSSDLFAYGISFAVIGKLWLAHHRFFSALARFDGNLMGLNLLYLAFIGLIPFTSQVLGDYPDRRAAVVLYAINLACVTATFQAQIVYSYRRELMRPETRDTERRYAGPANFLTALVFIVSIPVAFLSTDVASFMWLAVFFVGTRLSQLIGGR